MSTELLAQALKDAATSLETISRLAGKMAYLGDDGEKIPTYMEHHDQVRGYAACQAEAALRLKYWTLPPPALTQVSAATKPCLRI